MSIQKNVASQKIHFLMVDATDFASPEVSVSVTAKYIKDAGGLSTCSNTVSECTSGLYRLTLAATETNAGVVSFQMTGTGCADQWLIFYPEAGYASGISDLISNLSNAISTLDGPGATATSDILSTIDSAVVTIMGNKITSILTDTASIVVADNKIDSILAKTGSILVDTGSTLSNRTTSILTDTRQISNLGAAGTSAILSTLDGPITNSLSSILTDTGSTVDNKVDSILAKTTSILTDTSSTLANKITSILTDTGSSGVLIADSAITNSTFAAGTIASDTDIKSTLEGAGGYLSQILADTGTTLENRTTSILGKSTSTLGKATSILTDTGTTLENRQTSILGKTTSILTDTGTTLQNQIASILEDTGTTVDNKVDSILAKTTSILTDTGTTLENRTASILIDTGSILTDSSSTLANSIASILTDTNTTLPALLPAALVGGRIAAYIGASVWTVVAQAAAGCAADTIISDTTGLDATNDHYKGRIMLFTSGALKDQATDITAYVGATKTFTVTALTEAPADNDTFCIL